eukprot:gnl/TRDRNA2_/TRDRNA2_170425_c1_seq13.p1 gnl/TRDRNA2_/TRDRNA2_170425_c1~~gnl/TRDRNA2_/TRDRNA2_170425_c1_seq13.p1  ORF type:complete len:128 (-),score=9.91 gnl/TRDRNA2_/TRDRNA2_170425_c1_seq13:22-405(-)
MCSELLVTDARSPCSAARHEVLEHGDLPRNCLGSCLAGADAALVSQALKLFLGRGLLGATAGSRAGRHTCLSLVAHVGSHQAQCVHLCRCSVSPLHESSVAVEPAAHDIAAQSAPGPTVQLGESAHP